MLPTCQIPPRIAAVPFIPPVADAIQALRLATAELHHRLDQNLPLGREEATLADYAGHLLVVRDWQLALQPWLSRTGRSMDSLELIRQDLDEYAVTHGALPAVQKVDLETARRADDGSLAFCWGVAYVLEGSRLGGELMYRRLKAPLSPHPLRYLAQRNRNGPSWPEMLALLRRQLPTTADQAAACCGAVMTFELLVQQFLLAEVLA